MCGFVCIRVRACRRISATLVIVVVDIGTSAAMVDRALLGRHSIADSPFSKVAIAVLVVFLG